MSLPSTILEAGRALRARELSSEELVRATFSLADRLDPRLHIYIKRFDETALAAAAAADRDFAAGIDRGPLQGIPLGIKDIILTEEAPTTGGSQVVHPPWAQRRDAPVVANLRAAGAVITGKLTTVEFAVGVADPTKPLTMVGNPWNETHWAGSSSSGSAAGVGAHVVLGAVGTDTAGSVRHPAAYCGVTGIKPTYGRVSKADVIPLGPSLDCVGPLTHTAADAAAMLQAMAGYDRRDASTVDVAVPDYVKEMGRSLKGVRIGVERKNHLYSDLVHDGLPEAFEEAVAELERAGAVLTEVEFPNFQAINDAVILTLYAEALAYHWQLLRDQWDVYAPSTRMGIASGALFGANDYVLAQKVRRSVRRDVARLFEDVDLIVCPTGLKASPKFEGLDDLVDHIATIRTGIWSGLGNPAVSVPMGFSADQLPFGLQIAGRPFEEATVLAAADAYQRATDWHLRVPQLVQESTTSDEE